jgi:sodium-independent sulfate anion transporter 11
MSQETFALGLSNVLGAFFCAYPNTDAFARSAVMSKSGARTPMSSFFVGLIVIISIYVFTPVFAFISNASLAAIIAHSVTDLISGPTVWRKYWELNPSELLIFSAAYVISLFTRIDIADYVPVAISIVVQLYRSAHPRYAVLGLMDSYPECSGMSSSNEKKNSNMYAINGIISSLNNIMFFPIDHATLSQYIRPIDAGVICFQL